jgi:hypothetical protein
MGTDYVKRLALWSALVGVGIAVLCALLRQWTWAAGVAAGALWAIANLYMVQFLVVRYIRPEAEKKHDPKVSDLAVGLLFKFPLLYGIGFWLLQSSWFRIEALVLGFIVPFGVAFADALRRVAMEREA